MSPGPVCAGFIVGVALQLQQSALWPRAWYGVAVVLACALVGVLLRFGRRVRMASWRRVCLVFALAGVR